MRCARLNLVDLCGAEMHVLLFNKLNSIVEQAGTDLVRRAKLNLVDLAGSERVGRTNSDGTLLTEAKHINLSLHYLEQVIIALQVSQVLLRRKGVIFKSVPSAASCSAQGQLVCEGSIAEVTAYSLDPPATNSEPIAEMQHPQAMMTDAAHRRSAAPATGGCTCPTATAC